MAIDNLHSRCLEGWSKIKSDYEEYKIKSEGIKDKKPKVEDKKGEGK